MPLILGVARMADFHHASDDEPVSQVVQDPLEAGRDAVQRRDWVEGYELLHAADESGELAAEDLMLLAEAAMWVGHMDAVEPYFERAYRGYLQEGKTLRAAFVATWIAHNEKNSLQTSVANGWMSRAKRLLDLEEEAAEHGYWALQKSLDELGSGDFAEAFELARQGRGARPPLRRPQPRDSRPAAPGQRADRAGRGRRGQAPARRGERSRARRRARPLLDAVGVLQHDRRVPRRRRLRERRRVDRPGDGLLRGEHGGRLPRACAA